jgi:hypothetical protein
MMTKWMRMIVGVIAVAGLTGCATLPGVSRAREMRALNNVREVATACHVFAADHDGVLPASTGDLAPYLGKEFDVCQIELVASGKLSEIKDPTGVVLVRSMTAPSTGTRAVAFIDGHCELVPEE